MIAGKPEDPYRESLERIAQRAEMQFRLAAKYAASTTPEKEAEVLKLAARTGLPASFVGRNFEEIRKRLT